MASVIRVKDASEALHTANDTRFGLTAGLPTTIEGLTGPNGKAVGMDSFGYSGPYTVLDEKFGFTEEAVYKEVCDFLSI